MKRHILTILLLSMLISCTEELKITPFEYPQIFTGEVKKGWSIRSILLLQEGKGELPLGIDDCIKDDIYVFYNNSERQYQVTVGATKCDPGDPNPIVESNWSFVNASATLTIVMPLLSDDPLPFVVSQIDESRLVLDIYFDDDKSNYRFNFKPASVE